MKTPEGIAEQFTNPLVGDNATAIVQRSMLVETLANAIKADRAQRAENTITIELDAEHRPEETVAEILRQIEAGNTSGYYPNWEMQYDEPEETDL